jgi:ABC-type antimicrobial peptide transport system permease subunit
VAALDPSLPLQQAMTLEAAGGEGLAARRLAVMLMSAFSALALLLASVGVYAMPPFDPIALGGAAAILVGCATIALLVPVRRATRVDPTVALRAE